MTNYVTKPIPAEKPAVGYVERPWGSFRQFAFNAECTVSMMTVHPGQRLSLQSHTGRGSSGSSLMKGLWCRLEKLSGSVR